MINDRQIWFRRILWGYLPVHWKKLALLFGGIGIAAPSFLIGQLVAEQHLILSAACFVLSVGAVLALFTVAKQHSRD